MIRKSLCVQTNADECKHVDSETSTESKRKAWKLIQEHIVGN